MQLKVVQYILRVSETLPQAHVFPKYTEGDTVSPGVTLPTADEIQDGLLTTYSIVE